MQIFGKKLGFSYPDKNLIEKVVSAMSHLDMLARSPSFSKGGSCLMLLLKDSAHRLSIDIDILCSSGTSIKEYLMDYAANGFIDYQLIVRRQAGTDISTETLYRLQINRYNCFPTGSIASNYQMPRHSTIGI